MESEFQDTDFCGYQHVCDNRSQVVEWGFLEKYKQYNIARRKEAEDKAQMDMKIHCVGRGRGNLEGDLEEIYG